MKKHVIISLLSLFWLTLAAVSKPGAIALQIGVSESHQSAIQQQGPYALGWHILQLATDHSGADIVAVPAPWSWSIAQLKREQISAVFFANRTNARETWAQFSAPLAVTSADFFSNTARPIKHFDDARDPQWLIGVLKNTSHSSLLTEQGFTNLYPVLENSQLINLLVEGRLTHIFAPTNLVQGYCQSQKQRSCFTASGINQPSAIYLMGLRQDSSFKRFTQRLYQQLLELDQQGNIKPIFRQYGMTEHHYQYWLEILQQSELSAATGSKAKVP